MIAPGTLWDDGGVSPVPRPQPVRWVFARFTAGSIIATGCAQLTFLLVFGLASAPVPVAGVLAFLAGAVPNFLFYRYWAWQDTPLGWRGTLRYLGVIGFNGLAATGVTTAVNALVGAAIEAHAVRTVVLAVAFGASYVLLFVLKFVLLDRLVFGLARRRRERLRHQVPSITRA